MNFLELFLITIIILLLYTVYLYIGNYNNVVTQLEDIKLKCANINDSSFTKNEENITQDEKLIKNNNKNNLKKDEIIIENNNPEITEFDENGDQWSYI